ncbi:MAG: hypothetical protein LBB43_01785 [Spirochaetaceae bacterium]|jgi:hypothetical protein|nr:hypothetical protein [Spirochaetaceae bacterium]
MYVLQKFYILIAVLFFSMLFVSCKEMEMVFTTGTVYKVTAQVNGTTIEGNTIITDKDAIAPYFITSVAKDPDLRSLTVILQNSAGEIVMDKVCYTLGVPSVMEEVPFTSRDTIPTSENTTLTNRETSPSNEDSPPEELPPTSEDTTPTNEEPPLMTGELSPANEEITQTAEPEKFENWTVQRPISNPIANTRTIGVDSLAGLLPPFLIPNTVPPGQYSLIFQVQGEKAVLFTTEKQIYFIGDAEFKFNDIQLYIPDFSEQSSLIPTNTLMMLESMATVDSRLNPYIVWYFNKKEIAQGFISAGANKVLLDIADQVGFQTIGAELFPFPPRNAIKGKVSELSVPVSAKHKNDGFFSRKAYPPDSLYQFKKNLNDSKTPKTLAAYPINQAPTWLGAVGIYGLAIGGNPVYALPLPSFTPQKGEGDSGTIAFYAYFLADGTLFRALYRVGAVPVEISSFVYQGRVFLQSTVKDKTKTVSLDRFVLRSDVFYSLSYNFTVRDKKLLVGIAMGESLTESQVMTLEFDEPIGAFESFQLGKSENKRPVAIIDELAVWFTNPETVLSEQDFAESFPLAEEVLNQDNSLKLALSTTGL